MKKCSEIWVGLDIHKDSVSVAALGDGSNEPLLEQQVGPTDQALRRVLNRLARQGTLRACYEAGGFGYVLQRKMKSWGYPCEVVAPSLIPHRPGDQVKTDRRDALKLATYHRGGSLTYVYVPTEEDERWRSTVRMRRAYQGDAHRTQQRILKLLQARGHFYREAGKHWSQAFLRWLASLPLAASDRTLVDDLLAERTMQVQLMERSEARMAEMAQHPGWGPAMGRLQCLRGVDLVSSGILAVEIVDIARFASGTKLMGWAGLGVTEHSSGERVSRGHITKTGNSEVRRILIEAAWNNTRAPRVSETLKRRWEGQEPAVTAHAFHAQQRLYDTWRRLSPHGPKVAVTAMARLLAGFVHALWRARPEDLQARK